MKTNAGLSRGALIGIAAAAVLVIGGVVAFIATRSEPPPPPKETGPDPAELARRAREAKIAKIVGEVEGLEAEEKFEKALSLLDEADKLDSKHARITPVKARLEGLVRKLNQWRTAQKRIETLQKAAEGDDSVTAWKKVLEAIETAEKVAPTPTFATRSGTGRPAALQRRDWAEARELDEKGDLEGALRLAEKALAGGTAPPALTAFKTAVEKKIRKKEFNTRAIAARNETDPGKAIALWKAAKPFADEPADVKEVDEKIDALLPMVDVAVRDQRYAAALKKGETALAAGDFAAAEKAYLEARKLKGGDLKAGQGLRRVAAAKKEKGFETALAEGKACEEKRDWFGAVTAYRKALRIKPRDKSAAAAIKNIETNHRPPKLTVVLDRLNKISMDFVLVEPGKFKMGDAKGGSDETPHDVTLTRDYWIQTTEVTRRQWESLIPAKTPVGIANANLPADSVNWLAAQEFIKLLNAKSKQLLGGRTAGLPTEAEWEYACRAGARTRWHFGNTNSRLGDYAWFEKNSDRKLHPVKGKQPNAWGLYDMHGNVAEWCEDLYGKYAGPATDPTGAKTGEQRSIRGGSWNDRADACRAAVRQQARPERTSMSIGLRIVLR